MNPVENQTIATFLRLKIEPIHLKWRLNHWKLNPFNWLGCAFDGNGF